MRKVLKKICFIFSIFLKFKNAKNTFRFEIRGRGYAKRHALVVSKWNVFLAFFCHVLEFWNETLILEFSDPVSFRFVFWIRGDEDTRKWDWALLFINFRIFDLINTIFYNLRRKSWRAYYSPFSEDHFHVIFFPVRFLLIEIKLLDSLCYFSLYLKPTRAKFWVCHCKRKTFFFIGI